MKYIPFVYFSFRAAIVSAVRYIDVGAKQALYLLRPTFDGNSDEGEAGDPCFAPTDGTL